MGKKDILNKQILGKYGRRATAAAARKHTKAKKQNKKDTLA